MYSDENCHPEVAFHQICHKFTGKVDYFGIFDGENNLINIIKTILHSDLRW